MDALAAVWDIGRTALSVIALAIGGPGVVLWFLNRKGANRKLAVEEGGLRVDQFTAFNAALEREIARIDGKVVKLEEDLTKTREEAEINRWKLSSLRELFLRVINRAHVNLTEDELFELERTRPDIGK